MFSIFSDSYPFSSIDISIIFYTIIVMCGCSQTGGHQTGMPSGRALVFLQDAIPERGCCWFPVRSAEVSSASRTPHSLESPHTTAHPAKGRGWPTKEFTGCIRVHQKFTSGNTPTARRSAASSRPLRGGGQCMAIAPEAVHVEQERDFGRVFTLAAERGSLPWNCIDGESPPWVGARRGMGRSRRPHENGAGSL